MEVEMHLENLRIGLCGNDAGLILWFGNSQVCDLNGPLLVYHGSSSQFTEFSIAESCDGGFHFGTIAAAQARLDFWTDGPDDMHGQNIRPVYLRIVNPLVLTNDPYDEETWSDVICQAKKSGFDGIRYPNSVEGGESWVAFKPEQIQSAIGNLGNM